MDGIMEVLTANLIENTYNKEPESNIDIQTQKEINYYIGEYKKFCNHNREKNKIEKKIFDFHINVKGKVDLLFSGTKILYDIYQESNGDYSQYENKTIFSTDTHGDMMAFLYPGIVSGAYIFREGEPLIRAYNTATEGFLESIGDINEDNIENIIFLPNVHINPDFRGTYVSGGDDIDRGMHSEKIAHLKLNLMAELKKINKERGEKEKVKIEYSIGNHEDMLARGIMINEAGETICPSLVNGFRTFLGMYSDKKNMSILSSNLTDKFLNLSEKYKEVIGNGDMKVYTLLDNGMVAGHTIMNKKKITDISICFENIYENIRKECFVKLIEDKKFSSGNSFYSILKNREIFSLLVDEVVFEETNKKDIVDFINHISSNIDNILKYNEEISASEDVKNLKFIFEKENPLLWTRHINKDYNEEECRIDSIGLVVGHTPVEGNIYSICSMKKEKKEDIVFADVGQSHAFRENEESLAFFTILDNGNKDNISHQRMFFKINYGKDDCFYTISPKNNTEQQKSAFCFSGKTEETAQKKKVSGLKTAKTILGPPPPGYTIPTGFSNSNTKDEDEEEFYIL